jgi:hypothetical protein
MLACKETEAVSADESIGRISSLKFPEYITCTMACWIWEVEQISHWQPGTLSAAHHRSGGEVLSRLFITYLFFEELLDQIYSRIVCWNFGFWIEWKQTKEWDVWICQFGKLSKVPNTLIAFPCGIYCNYNLYVRWWKWIHLLSPPFGHKVTINHASKPWTPKPLRTIGCCFTSRLGGSSCTCRLMKWTFDPLAETHYGYLIRGLQGEASQ